MISLRPYQREAIAAVGEAGERGIRRPLVALPTGTGKTVIFSELIRQRANTGLILAHRDELIQQAHDKLVQVAPELALSVGIVKAGLNEVTAPIVIASVQTLARERRLAQLPRSFHTAVCDEAHHAAADSYLRVFEHLGESPLLLGVTATPERSDSRRLKDVWEELVYARSIEEMIAEGYLSDLRGVRVKLDVDLRAVKTSRGDFQTGDLGRALEEANAPEGVAASYAEHAADRKGLVFTPTVALAKLTAHELRRHAIPAESLDATTPLEDRRAMLKRLKSGETQAICNVGVLTEGFDEPSIDCIVVASPTKSRIKYVQMVGRGTRIFPGKADCLILDVVGVSEKMSVQSIPELFGLEEPPRPDETVTEAQRRQAEKHAAREGAAKEAAKRRRAEGFLPFSREAINWQHVGERWVTSGGQDELLVLDPTEAGFRVFLVGKNRAKRVAHHLDLGYAQGVAEEVIRQRSSTALADTRARWRSADVTKGQRSFLQKLGIPVDGLTRGEASDLLNVAIARERLKRLDRVLEARRREASDSSSLSPNRQALPS